MSSTFDPSIFPARWREYHAQQTRIYVAAEPVDMRRSFHGLAAAVRGQMQLEPGSGHLFVFLNRRVDSDRYWTAVS